MVGWVVGTTALYKRLDSIQTSWQSTGKFCISVCSKSSVLLSEITWLTSLAFAAMRVSGWMGGSVGWLCFQQFINFDVT